MHLFSMVFSSVVGFVGVLLSEHFSDVPLGQRGCHPVRLDPLIPDLPSVCPSHVPNMVYSQKQVSTGLRRITQRAARVRLSSRRFLRVPTTRTRASKPSWGLSGPSRLTSNPFCPHKWCQLVLSIGGSSLAMPEGVSIPP